MFFFILFNFAYSKESGKVGERERQKKEREREREIKKRERIIKVLYFKSLF